jgi:chromosome segregation ATPase
LAKIAQLELRLANADSALAEAAAERSAALVRAHRAEDDTTTAQRELTLEKRSNRLRQEQLKRVSSELETIRGRMLEAEHMAELRQTQLVELLDKDSSTATQVAVLSRQLKVSNDSLAAAEQRVIDLQKRLKVAEIDAADAQAEVAKMQHYADEAAAPRRQRARETSPTAVQAMAMEIERDRAERAEQHVAELEAAAAEAAANQEQQANELRAARDETSALAQKLREAASLVRQQSELLKRAKAELDEQRELDLDVREDLTAQTRHIELMHDELEALERQRDEVRTAYDEVLAAHASQDDELRGELDTAHGEIESLRAQLDAVSSGLARAVNLCTQQRSTIESQREADARSERAASLAADERLARDRRAAGESDGGQRRGAQARRRAAHRRAARRRARRRADAATAMAQSTRCATISMRSSRTRVHRCIACSPSATHSLARCSG